MVGNRTTMGGPEATASRFRRNPAERGTDESHNSGRPFPICVFRVQPLVAAPPGRMTSGPPTRKRSTIPTRFHLLKHFLYGNAYGGLWRASLLNVLHGALLPEIKKIGLEGGSELCPPSARSGRWTRSNGPLWNRSPRYCVRIQRPSRSG